MIWVPKFLDRLLNLDYAAISQIHLLFILKLIFEKTDILFL
jgi:hypothetical protein